MYCDTVTMAAGGPGSATLMNSSCTSPSCASHVVRGGSTRQYIHDGRPMLPELAMLVFIVCAYVHITQLSKHLWHRKHGSLQQSTDVRRYHNGDGEQLLAIVKFAICH